MAAASFETVGAQELMEEPLDPPTWLVDRLLPTRSTSILASPPKFGKSIFVLQLCLAVAEGREFLGRSVTQAPACYLALEDTKWRLQQRLWLLADTGTDELQLATQAGTLNDGLIEQMQQHLRDHPGTKLFVIDTLQVARGVESVDYSYSHDYEALRKIKSFADSNGVSVVLVHHTRKARDPSDQMMDISGTTAISGAVDQLFVLQKDARSSDSGVLSATGRDIEYIEIKLRREGLGWAFVEQLTEAEAYEATLPDCIPAIARLVNEQGDWEGTATELLSALSIIDVTPAALGRHLAQHHVWLASQGVAYEKRRTMSARIISLKLLDSGL